MDSEPASDPLLFREQSYKLQSMSLLPLSSKQLISLTESDKSSGKHFLSLTKCFLPAISDLKLS